LLAQPSPKQFLDLVDVAWGQLDATLHLQFDAIGKDDTLGQEHLARHAKADATKNRWNPR
jgi:hypothetical protein